MYVTVYWVVPTNFFLMKRYITMCNKDGSIELCEHSQIEVYSGKNWKYLSR